MQSHYTHGTTLAPALAAAAARIEAGSVIAVFLIAAELTARERTADDARSISERMVMNEDARAAELMGKMLRKKLYVLISKPLVPPS